METETLIPQATAIEFSPQIGEFCAAMAKAQGEMANAERDAENPHFGKSYASLAAVWDAIRKPLTSNGFCVVQGEKTRIKPDLSGGEVDVATMVLHSSGQWFRTTVTLPIIPMARRKNSDGDSDSDRAPGKITPQAIGSAITYGRRYGLESTTGIAPEAAEDDDGNAASGAEKREAIPASGSFEDVIESVTFQEKPKKAGGTFTVALVKTGKHGPLECWENVGNMAQGHAGTGVACALKAEKGQYGWRLLDVQPIQAPEAAYGPTQGSAGVANGKEKSVTAQEVELKIEDMLVGAKTIAGLKAIKDLLVVKGKTNSLWFSVRVKEMLDAKHKELGGAKPAPESTLNTAAAA